MTRTARTQHDIDEIISQFPDKPAKAGQRVITKTPDEVNTITKEVGKEGKPERLFGTYARRIDKFSIKRVRVEMTPSVCPKCRLDLAKINGLKPWRRLNEQEQAAMKQAVRDHVNKVHDISEQDIVSESELPKRFLGTKAEQEEKENAFNDQDNED